MAKSTETCVAEARDIVASLGCIKNTPKARRALAALVGADFDVAGALLGAGMLTCTASKIYA